MAIGLEQKQTIDAAATLQKSKEKILQRWEKVVRRELDEARNETKPTLRDSLPQFLDRLADALRELKLGGMTRSHLVRVACEHAEDRAAYTDYSLEQVIKEYEILRKVVFDALESEKLLPRLARETILDAVTTGMAKATEQFAETVAKREEDFQEQLDETEDLFQSVFEFAASGKAIIDIQSQQFLRANRKLCSMLGYSENELRNLTFTDVTYPDDRGWQKEVFHQKLMEKSDGWSVEKRYLKKDGSTVWAFVTGAVLVDRHGRPTKLISTIQDITERKRAEEQVRENEEYLRRIFESSEDCFKVISLDGILLELAEASRRHLEIEEESNVIGSNWIEFWKRTHDFEAAKEAVRKAKEGGKGQFIGHYKTPSGKREWWDVVITPIRGKDGKPEKLLVVSRDVTAARKAEEDLRESEERFRALADNIPQLAWMANADGEIFWFNQKWYDFTGTRPEEMTGFDWLHKVHHPDFVEKSHPRYLQHIREGQAWEDTFPLRSKDGQFHWFLSRAVPLKDASGNVQRWFGTNTDITNEKRSTEMLEEERRLREQFVNTLSHDLRTPLSVIRMAAQIIEMDTNQPDVLELIQRILKNVSMSDQMIQDLLDANRIRAGRGISLDIEFMRMSDVVEEAIKNLELVFGSRFKLKTSGNTDGYWSPRAIRRVTENLSSNAFKYGAPNQPITISVKDLGDQVQLCVHNLGSSIQEEEKKNLFEQFSRAKAAEISGKKGWGIGLTIVKGIADAHCAKIEVTSLESDGTTFSIIFPRDTRACQDARLKGQEGT